MGRPDYILVNFEKPRDAAMRNTGLGFVVLSHHSLFCNVNIYDAMISFLVHPPREADCREVVLKIMC